MTITRIQDFPVETFEHYYKIGTEHTEFHSYSSFYQCPLHTPHPKTTIVLLRKSVWIKYICQEHRGVPGTPMLLMKSVWIEYMPALEAAGSPGWSPSVYYISFFRFSFLSLVYSFGRCLGKKTTIDANILTASARA